MQKADLFSVVKYGDHQRHFMKQNLLIGKLINERLPAFYTKYEKYETTSYKAKCDVL